MSRPARHSLSDLRLFLEVQHLTLCAALDTLRNSDICRRLSAKMPGPALQRNAHCDLTMCTVPNSINLVACMHVAPCSCSKVRTCMTAGGFCLRRPLSASLHETYLLGSCSRLRGVRAAVLSREHSRSTSMSSMKGCTFEVNCLSLAPFVTQHAWRSAHQLLIRIVYVVYCAQVFGKVCDTCVSHKHAPALSPTFDTKLAKPAREKINKIIIKHKKIRRMNDCRCKACSFETRPSERPTRLE
jgi:hypothetical protein